MLSNGMKESAKGAPIVIRVTEQEKPAFKEMLQFLYSGTLSPEFLAPATSMSSIVALLLLGDKYEVPSFMGAVLKRLIERESISDSATLVEEVPDLLERRPQIKQLMDDARGHIVREFKDVTGTWTSDDFMALPLGVVQYLLQSEELEADSEEEILTKAAKWAANKTGALSQLFPYIRFCCIRGEVLEKWAQTARSFPNVQLIKRALKVQAYSDARKRLEKGLVFCERKGVQQVHLEIVENIRFDEKVTSVVTPPVVWFGKTWYLAVMKEGAQKKGGEEERPRTVGVYLFCKKAGDQETVASVSDKVQICAYVRTWPDGLWFPIGTTTNTFSLEEGKGVKNWGFPDALNLPWDEARKSEKFLGPTGAMVFKVVARRYTDSEAEE
ncbi:hypothetical protein KFL_000350020 [Klebsormidium nitens]|uniref:BACK domain-containing protein n=1 Tax=Klebsormidium nitens TaxID=105231 RepID=A0A1Y1HSV6_KLENI|nr:hypothetical protein KFL_000350020 [Klebsormidium nitens]|eukprot:GAQ79646.1 hypothetical protein KFL_000350020 [Klebsormidium nitens]